MPASLEIRPFFDEATKTVTYLIWDRTSRAGAVVDPVLGFDLASGEADTDAADRVLRTASTEGVRVAWTLETHAHADHLSAAPYLKLKTGARIGIGEHIREVQRIFQPRFNARDLRSGGGDFDTLFAEGHRIPLGALEIEVLHTPGHTPADVSYRIENAVFVGDTLFMPDYGTARADFPGGDARRLYQSIRRLLDLPAATRMFMCHDYKAPGRDHYVWESTVEEQRRKNVHIRDGIAEEQFVAMRRARDATLGTPALFMPSIQVNIRAGRFPPAEANGVQYLLVPVKTKDPALAEAIGTRGSR